MKKIFTLLGLVFIAGTLSACSDTVSVPDFMGKEYGDVLKWVKDYDIEISVVSEYNDDVEPGSIYFQSVEAGEKMSATGILEIKYSRGYNPDTIIDVPDFTGKSMEDITTWLVENNIKKYSFQDTFDLSKGVGEYVSYEVSNTENRTSTLRRDTYTFNFSRGPIEIEEVAFDQGALRGVNLGGWFVLEGWMSPDLFNGINGSDETIFMEEAENAAERLETHWNTFITEEDFEYLSNHGVDYVRIPIPWWYQGESFTYTHEGVTHNIQYLNSEFYIERAMEWAADYNIKVLLDLHTAPGCQNGFDNGGISGVLQWEQPQNVAKTIEVLKDITIQFSPYSSLWGIELLNEPGWGVNLGTLMDFYKDAYLTIREENPTVWIGMHDGFRMYLEGDWSFFFRQNAFSNVFFDVHLYQTFGDDWGQFDIHDHLDWVEVEQYKAVHRYNGIVPVVVGEWSLGLQGNVYEGLNADSIFDLKVAYGNKQLNVYEGAFGWFFWSYKIDQTSHLEWDFKRLIESGIFPDNFADDEEE